MQKEKVALTKEQERLWLEWKLDPRSHSYNTTVQLRLDGQLDADRFLLAIRSGIEYFESFRTYFTEHDGKASQIVGDFNESAIKQIDLSNENYRTIEDLEIRAKFILAGKLQTPYNLKDQLLTEFYFIKVSENLHYFAFFTPHIICDGNSASRWQVYLSEVYNKGESSFEENKTIAEYVEFAANKTSQEEKTLSMDYWTECLKGNSLHFDFGRPKKYLENSKQGKRKHFSLVGEDFVRLKKLARQERTTLFIILAALYNTFLYRLYSAKDIVICYPVSIRPKEFKNLFGFFVNNVPLLTSMVADLSFSQLVRQISEQRKLDRVHQELSLNEIVKGLRENGQDISDNILNTSLVKALFSINELQLDEIKVLPVNFEYEEVNGDFSLLYDIGSESLEMAWEYRSALFSDEQTDYYTDIFINIIKSVLRDPNKEVSKIELLSDEQEKEILYISNSTSEVQNFELTICDSFNLAVKNNPDEIAIIFGQKNLTYKQLDQRSNLIANYLSTKKLGKNSVVAVCLDPSIEQIATLLGIIKIGAAYVPIDTSIPKERFEKIMEDSGAGLVVKEVISSEGSDNEDNCKSKIMPEDNLCIIYTSGSTGAPKGVKVSHRNLVSRFKWFDRTYKLRKGERVLHNINYCFDPSLYEIFWTLSSGATIVINEKPCRNNPDDIIQLIENHNIVLASFVPSLLDKVLERVEGNKLASMRYIISGGEALTVKTKDKFYKQLDAQLSNQYGPTEGTILSTNKLCLPGDEVITIGQSIDGTQLYILDENMQILPIGAKGEIYIGGVGISSGYISDKSKTEECFVDSPFNNGSKLYKTGDIARYLESGEIEFLGRIDDQVKIRGYRVELKEIEIAMLNDKSVREAIVLLKSIESGVKKIVAYYTGENVAEINLKKILQSRLPDYMIPEYFIKLGEMPKNQNGKIDKSKLPELSARVFTKQIRFSEPKNDHEIKIRGIWARILETDPRNVGVTDKFFEIGGDSLQVLELTMHIEEEFNIKISDADIFGLPTIRQCASFLMKKEPDSSEEVRINQRGRIKRKHSKGKDLKDKLEAHFA